MFFVYERRFILVPLLTGSLTYPFSFFLLAFISPSLLPLLSRPQVLMPCHQLLCIAQKLSYTHLDITCQVVLLTQFLNCQSMTLGYAVQGLTSCNLMIASNSIRVLRHLSHLTLLGRRSLFLLQAARDCLASHVAGLITTVTNLAAYLVSIPAFMLVC